MDVHEFDPLAGAPSLESLRSRFNAFDDITDEARRLSFRDRSYYDGKGQIGKEWKATLKDHQLPDIYINKIKPIVNGHVGVLLQQQTDPQAYPRKEQDTDAAAVATKILRYVSDQQNLKQKNSEAALEFFIEGTAAMLLECSNTEVFATPISFREFAYDPYSRMYDFSDATWLGFVKWQPVDNIKSLFPDAYDRLGSPSNGDLLTVSGTGFNQSPTTWVDKVTKRLQVVEMYYMEGGVWRRVVWCHAGILDFGDSDYTDDQGLSICPIIAMSCYIEGDPDGSNARYGIVRDCVKPQDEYNAHRALALKHAVSRRVQQVDPNAEPVDADTVRKEAARPDGVIPSGWQEVPSNRSQEEVAFMQLSEAELSRMGPTPAVLGRSLGASESGRSRQVQAAAGMTEINILLDRIERWRETQFRHIWYRVRQYWDEEQYIRVTGQGQAAKFVKINVPKVQEIEAPMVGPDGQPMVDPYTGQPLTEMQPQIVGYENHVATMDMDITVVSVPENVNLEHETFTELVNLISSTGIPVGTPQFMMMLQLAPLTNKTEIIEKIEGLMEKAAQDSAQETQMQQQMAEMQRQLDMLQGQAKADKDSAAAAKSHAQTERTQVETGLMLGRAMMGMPPANGGGMIPYGAQPQQ